MTSLRDKYSLDDCIDKTDTVMVHRGTRREDGLRVIIKQSPQEFSPSHWAARLSHEFAILQHLQATLERRDGVPQPLELHESGLTCALVTEDRGCTALRTITERAPLPIEELLTLCDKLLSVVARLHAADVLHKDINPSNIVYNRDTQYIELIDFGIASWTKTERMSGSSRRAFQGTLPFAPPEQLGMLSQHLDARSDLYSVGATIFTLLTGAYPFDGPDEANVLHQIMTEMPPSPSAVDTRVPRCLAEVVLKAMAKDPADRYQSSNGLRHDLQRCLQLIASPSTFEERFALGTHDRDGRLEFSDKLYGRDEEVSTLTAALTRAVARANICVAVAGVSGAGKSALVASLQHSLTAANAHYAAGKHDQLNRNTPLYALSEVIAKLVEWILGESPARMEMARRRVAGALGNLAGALVEVFPSLEKLTGKVPTVAVLAPHEAENRLHLLLQRLIGAFAGDSPITIFLDDMQWADPGTLRFVDEFAHSREKSAGVLLVIAYRSEEVHEAIPLRHRLEGLRESNLLDEIVVGPLTVHATGALLKDLFGESTPRLGELAEMVHAKTEGNPFFQREYLIYLERARLISFDQATLSWIIDFERIRQTHASDNVVEMLGRRIEELDPGTQLTLAVAACLGSEFRPADLRGLMGGPTEELEQSLRRAQANELIFAVEQTSVYAAADDEVRGTFKFVHDRVQQAAAARLAPDALSTVRGGIGLHLLALYQREPRPVLLHLLLGHLNAARPHTLPPGGALQLVDLNLAGALEANRASAYGTARDYLEAATQLLGGAAWESQPRLTMQLEIQLAENAYLMGDHERASQRLLELRPHCTSDEQRMEIDFRHVRTLAGAGKMPAALQIGFAALAQVGIKIPKRVRPWHLVFPLLRLVAFVLSGQVSRSLKKPPNTDRRLNLAFELVGFLIIPTIHLDNSAGMLLIFQSAPVVLRAGPNPMSASSLYNIATAFGLFGRAAASDRYRKLAFETLQRVPNSLNEPMLRLSNAVFLGFARSPKEDVPAFRAVAEAALVAGDHVTAALANGGANVAALVMSAERVAQETEISASFGAQYGSERTRFALRQIQAVRDLLVGTTTPEEHAAQGAIDQVEADRLGNLVSASFACNRMVGHAVMGNYAGAWQLAGRLNPAVLIMSMLAFQVLYIVFLGCLSFNELRRGGSTPTRAERRTYRRLRRRLASAVASATAPLRGLCDIIDATAAHARGDKRAAYELFTRGLVSVSQTPHPLLVAVSYEAAARFFGEQPLALLGDALRDRAIDAYALWGATAKVNALVGEARRNATQRTTLGRSTRQKTTSRTTDTADLGTEGRILRGLGPLLGADSSQEAFARALIGHLIATARSNRVLVRVFAGGSPVDFDSATAGTIKPERILTRALKSARAICEPDAAGDLSEAGKLYSLERPVKAVLCVPLMLKERCIGLVLLENEQLREAFDVGLVQLLEDVAPVIAMAMETRSATRMPVPVPDVDMVRVIEERERTESRMAGGFAHEMRNALSAISYPLPTLLRTEDFPGSHPSVYEANAELLAQLQVSPAVEELRTRNEDLRDALLEMARGLKRSFSVVNQVLDFARASHLVAGHERVEFAALIDKVVHEYAASFAAAQIGCNVATAPGSEAFIAEPHAYAIVRNLIDNARDAVVMATNDARPRQVDVQVGGDSRTLVVSVTDTGVGINSEQAQRIFQPFFSTKGSAGTGLGLGLSRKLAQAYGGKLTFTSEPTKGTTFRLELPRPPRE